MQDNINKNHLIISDWLQRRVVGLSIRKPVSCCEIGGSLEISIFLLFPENSRWFCYWCFAILWLWVYGWRLNILKHQIRNFPLNTFSVEPLNFNGSGFSDSRHVMFAAHTLAINLAMITIVLHRLAIPRYHGLHLNLHLLAFLLPSIQKCLFRNCLRILVHLDPNMVTTISR